MEWQIEASFNIQTISPKLFLIVNINKFQPENFITSPSLSLQLKLDHSYSILKKINYQKGTLGIKERNKIHKSTLID